ncbi:hypothetical protein [Croceivirga sp. JEA036]|uniref:hypothetical protein n=1 Tax=Croceivirga sp. JEA036 TaxID=2721162 RepID=UPI0014390EDB|nr:hypothetical protein [Croceivirga sp. JEA036]NJB36391.1 hypothetical protein [Croceivirga sp. JEA036]
MDFEPVDIEFLINEPEVRKNAKKVKDQIKGIAEDSEDAVRQVNNQVERLQNATGASITQNAAALRNQRAQYDGLGNSLNQITRELPAFTFSMQTGFLAISNNLPILADEIGRIKAQNDLLVASGKKGIPVWRQVVGSLFSWNTALSLGVTLLTIYGPQLVDYFTKLFNGGKAIDQAKAKQEALNKAFEDANYKTAIKDVVEVGAAFAGAATDVDKKRKALELYNDKFGDALGTANNYNQAEQLFREKSDAYVRALLYRAAALAAVNEASAKLIEITKEEDRLSEKIEAKGGTRSATSTFATKKLREERSDLQREEQQLNTTYNRIINGLNQKADALVKAFDLKLEDGSDKDALKLVKERKKLLDQIAALDTEFAKQQLDKDGQELKALKDKFSKIRALVQEFNANPNNAQVKINLTELNALEAKSFDQLYYQQETRFLKSALEEQKQLYEDYAEYVKDFGVAKAKEEFSARLGAYDTYLQLLEQKVVENQDAFTAVNNGTATAPQAERVRLLKAALEKEQSAQAQHYQELLASLQDYEQRRTRLVTDYQNQRQLLLANGNFAEADQLKRNFTADLADLDEAYAKGTEEYKALIRGVEGLSTTAARTVIANARKMVEALQAAGRLSADTAAEINSKIDELEQNVDAGVGQNFSKIAQQAKEIGGAFQALGQEVGYFDEGLGDTIETLGEVVNVLGDAAEAGARFASGDIVGGIASSLKAITGLFSIGRRARESRKQAEAELLRLQQEIEDGERRLAALQRERNIAKAEEVELTLKGLDARRESLKLAQQEIAIDQQRLLAELQQEQFITNSYTEKYGGFLGIGRKTRVVNEYEDLLGKTFEEIEALYEKGVLTDRATELFEQLRDLRQEGQDVNALLGDLERQSQELFTGTTATGIADSIIEGLRQGYDSFEDFAGDIEKLLQGAILNAIRYQTLEEPLQRLFEEFAAYAESDGELTQSEADAIRAAYQTQVQRALDQYEQLSDVLDLDQLDTSAATGLQGAIRRELTEETASELTGLFRGQFDITKRHFELHERHFEIDRQNLDGTLRLLASSEAIRNNTALMVVELQRTVAELMSINKNTTKPQTQRDLGK